MNEVKPIKQSDKRIEPELRRLVCSMASVLRRKYPNPAIRRAVSEEIMQDLLARAVTQQ
jgi:hypothetical protein